MQIERSNTCNNSPKNRFVEEFTLAIFQEKLENFKEQHTEQWFEIVGQVSTELADQITEIQRIKIISSISHGKFGACTGVLSAKQQTYSFVVHYEFVSTTKKVVDHAKLFLIEEKDN
ncbi:hypothetical protein IV487_09685 [Enterococcus saccharolyticus]|uniref:Uncharacterized protein n=1 Tax=Candidatus Enterococcus willemsii TaxID=1857215 RepID=A0ABQ6Z1W4_9ENTE|nr:MULTISPECIES: hypothetical protein [Enterococcus]KAF1305509.1 hypothetical protein BAU17_07420 [Enterococcus sp. CU12B]MCD5002733.1 hypothetical protein [Enterococcus saccharolyticus]